MRFMIHGADQKTGREMTVVMEAPDESEAERRALYNDILVSSVARFTAGAASAGAAEFEARHILAEVTATAPATTALPYHPAEFPAEARGAKPPHPAAAVPAYGDVLHGARWLDRLGLLARWGGGAAILAGVALIAIALVDPLRQRLALPAHPWLFLAAAAVVTALGVLCVLCGVMVSMTSGLVVAVRDVAHNTFHIAARPTPPESPADEAATAAPGMTTAMATAPAAWLRVTTGPVIVPALLDPAPDHPPRAVLQATR